MAQQIVNGEQYEAFLIKGDIDGGAVNVEGEVDVDGLQGASAFSITPNDGADLALILLLVLILQKLIYLLLTWNG